MWSIISSIVQGFFSAVTGPVAQAVTSVMNKKADVTLQGFQAASDQDKVAYQEWLSYQVQLQQLKTQASNWWGAKLVYMIVAVSAAMHIAAINLDSTFLFNWQVAKLPAPYDQYEAYLVGSLFVIPLASGPVSAVTSWLHKK